MNSWENKILKKYDCAWISPQFNPWNPSMWAFLLFSIDSIDTQLRGLCDYCISSWRISLTWSAQQLQLFREAGGSRRPSRENHPFSLHAVVTLISSFVGLMESDRIFWGWSSGMRADEEVLGDRIFVRRVLAIEGGTQTSSLFPGGSSEAHASPVLTPNISPIMKVGANCEFSWEKISSYSTCPLLRIFVSWKNSIATLGDAGPWTDTNDILTVGTENVFTLQLKRGSMNMDWYDETNTVLIRWYRTDKLTLNVI